jgi:hypothetical protein
VIVMAGSLSRPTVEEVRDFLRELNRVALLGGHATRAERRALQARKVDLFRRMALHPDPFTASEALDVAVIAEDEADRLRAGKDEWGEW